MAHAAEPTEYVRVLDGGPLDERIAGGKAAALNRLVALGASVPPGFVVGTDAYRRFVQEGGLGPLVEELRTGELAPPELHERERERVDAAFLAAPLPAAVAAELGERAARLGDGPFAVRSSATAEDLAGASFAGQYRSLLDVDADGLADAVRLVWASLWHPAPRSYRRHRSIAEDDLDMAVLVMPMLRSITAGVVFTIDPGGRPGAVRIEIVEGLGEALVSGRRTPEVRVVDRVGYREALAGEDAYLTELVDAALDLEERLGAPQDIEWALDADGLHLVQSRPITTAPAAVPTGKGTDDGLDVAGREGAEYTTAGIAEMLPGVLPPRIWEPNSWFMEEGFRRLFDRLGADTSALDRPHALVGRFRGRAALNLDAMKSAAGSIPGGSAQELERQYFGAAGGPEGADEPTSRAGPVQGARLLRARMDAAQDAEIAIQAVRRLLDLEPDARRLSLAELLDLRARVLLLGSRTAAAEVAIAAMAAAAYRGAERFLIDQLGEAEGSEAAQVLTRVDSGDRRGRLALELEPLAAEQRGDGQVARLIAEADWVDAEPVLRGTPEGRRFLERYDAALRRAGSTAVFGGPSWDRVPAMAWLTLRRIGAEGDRGPADAGRRRARDEVEARLRGAPGRPGLSGRLGRLLDVRLHFFRREASDAAAFLDMREQTKAALLRLGGVLGRVDEQIGSRLAASGALARAADVDLLVHAELRAMVAGGGPSEEAIEARRRRHAAAVQAPPLERRFTGSPGAARGPAPAGDSFHGWPASPGRYEGPARVITAPTSGALRPGEVLVAPRTDASWTPLFLQAGAIVVEEGAPLSHAAIVARELGTPAVVNVPGIVARLQAEDRQLLASVDGTSGEVVVHEPVGPEATRGDATPHPASGVAPARSAPEAPAADGRLGVFVTGLIGAGALMSVIFTMTEAVSSARGRRRIRSRAAPVADALSHAVALGFAAEPTCAAGLRSRDQYAWAGAWAALLAILAGVIAIGGWVDSDGGSWSVALWSVAVAGVANLALAAGALFSAAARWPRVPDVVRRVMPARPRGRLSPIGVLGWRRAALIALGAIVVATLAMAIAAGADWLQTADQAVYDRLDAGRHHDDRLPGWLGELFDPELIIPLALLISLAMYRCRPLAIAFPLAIVLSGLLHVGLAHLVPRERPELGERAGQFDSFPGGHVNELVLLLGLLPLALAVLTKSPRAGAIARVVATALLVVLLANALLVGDHWPSDNLAGICIAGALVIAVHGIAAARPLHTRCRDCLSQRTTGEP